MVVDGFCSLALIKETRETFSAAFSTSFVLKMPHFSTLTCKWLGLGVLKHMVRVKIHIHAYVYMLLTTW